MKASEQVLTTQSNLADELLPHKVIGQQQHSISQQQLTRLPCRGCLASCKNYLVCDGKLWRMNP